MNDTMRYCKLALALLLATCLSGCYMAGSNIPQMNSWSTPKEPPAISVEKIEWSLWADQKLINRPDKFSNKQMNKMLQEASTKALEDSRQFSEIIPYTSESSPFSVDFSYRDRVITNGFTVINALLMIVTATVIPYNESFMLEQDATFTNRQTGKSLTIHNKESMERYVWLFALPFISGHSWDDAHTDMAYRLTQKAIDDARRAGFFTVESGAGKNEFF